jgi:hypothetical protein
MPRLYRPVSDEYLSGPQRFIVSRERADYKGQLIKFLGRVNGVRPNSTATDLLDVETIPSREPVYVVDVCYLYVWGLAARRLFFICLYNEELFYVQEDETEYALYTE